MYKSLDDLCMIFSIYKVRKMKEKQDTFRSLKTCLWYTLLKAKLVFFMYFSHEENTESDIFYLRIELAEAL